jgi:hypothetical protein
VPRGEEGKQPRTLYRASTSKRKISTSVGFEEAPKFHALLVATMKSNMSALRKKEKKAKSKKSKAKAAAAQ